MTTSLNCASHTANKVWSRETLPVIEHITYMVLQDTSRTCSSATAEHSFLYKSHCEQYCGRFLSWSVWSAVALASSMVSVWHHLWAFQSRCCAVKCLNQTHLCHGYVINTSSVKAFTFSYYLDSSVSFSKLVSSPSKLRGEHKRLSTNVSGYGHNIAISQYK